jgi:type II secretory ATPase GspE/PulE/Tfp pilus assembly ATPase PilB-like protein
MPDAKPTPPTPLQKKLAEINREAEERDAQRRAANLGYPYADLSKLPVALAAIKLIPEAEAKEAQAASIEVKAQDVALAAVDPTAPAAKAIVGKLEEKRYRVKLFVCSRSGLEQAWRLYRFVPPESAGITGKLEIGKQRLEEFLGRLTTFQAVQKEMEKLNFKTATTTTLFETILAGALANRASDIHFEAEEETAKIRYRLDGILHDIFGAIPPRNYDQLVSRIKLLSGLKINIKGEPQDGRFTIAVTGKEIEVRVSIIPSEFGETIVMRLLDPDTISVSLTALGLRPDDLTLIQAELAKPNGLILNTGPTGSGKTTTLYAFLKSITKPEIKIITIEDPIEYRVLGVEQTQTDPEVGYTFASGLRAILRQDPDAILVGEIRDKETADIAMQASLTGHLVFSTLHTNDAVGAVPRLIDLGVRPATVGPALTLIIAQRLVRVLCPKCKKPGAVPKDLAAKIEKFLTSLPAHVDRTPYRKITVFKPVGCPACNSFGYRGRRGIFEFLHGGPELEELILKESSEVAIRRLAQGQGIVPMQQDGILKVIVGDTTFAEVEETTGPINW